MALRLPDPTPDFGPPEVEATVDAIAACQQSDGSIPWADGHVDPWNHVEAAMALDVGGRRHAAERAYRWLARRQRSDGSWCAAYRDGRAVDHGVDANFCAYIAAGLWHHTVVTGDDELLRRLWPILEGGIGVACGLQRPGGEIGWARRADGSARNDALLTSSACIHLSLRRALEAADHLGLRRPSWERAAHRVASAVAEHPERFLEKSRFSMDWYYPVLAGCLGVGEARRRLEERWAEFVLDDLGCRCVNDRPWFTAAETCELVLALDAVGMRSRAWRLFGAVQAMRTATGSYWTGLVLPEACPWPEEQPAWTGAAVVLAADALLSLTAASGFFRADATGIDDALLEAEGA